MSDAKVRQQIKRQERHELLGRIQGWVDTPLTILAFVMLGLLLLDLTASLGPFWARQVRQAQEAIWAIFLLTFVLEFVLAPDKSDYLKENWLGAISVALPAFRAVRIFRVAAALRELSLVRVLTTLNRGARALGTIARRGELGYILGLTLLVTLTAAVATFYFEQGSPRASITSIGDAFWWAFTLVTTINTGLEPVTLEGRIIGVLMRVFALAISGYLTAVIAVHLLGFRQPNEDGELEREMRLMREELARLRALVAEQGASPRPRPSHADDD
ncbi:MAG TPA: ion transporter [Thermomicrobiaceae bacterium]|nr:ion transporter [Thermomicrobiaceae bacterium]